MPKLSHMRCCWRICLLRRWGLWREEHPSEVFCAKRNPCRESEVLIWRNEEDDAIYRRAIRKQVSISKVLSDRWTESWR